MDLGARPHVGVACYGELLRLGEASLPLPHHDNYDGSGGAGRYLAWGSHARQPGLVQVDRFGQAVLTRETVCCRCIYAAEALYPSKARAY